jgi:hypothetical protein
MPTRETKTREELTALLMHEMRQHPDCDHVVRISIDLATRHAPHHPNWTALWTVRGDEVVCPRALRIETDLQARFDLA